VRKSVSSLRAQLRAFVACVAACVRCLRGGVRSFVLPFVARAAACVRCVRARAAFVACSAAFVRLQWQERKIETKKDSVFLPVE
jgi:hypothetical protein